MLHHLVRLSSITKKMKRAQQGFSRHVFLDLDNNSKRVRQGIIEEPGHSDEGEGLNCPSSSMEDDNNLESDNEGNHDFEEIDEELFQEILESNTVLQDEEIWSDGVDDTGFDSSESWLKQPQEVQSIMKELLKFCLSSELSELSLHKLFQLISNCVDIATQQPSLNLKSLLNLKSFYKHYNLNKKTRKVHYCRTCRSFQGEVGCEKGCKCGHDWKSIFSSKAHLMLRPLQYHFQQRMEVDPGFLETISHGIEQRKAVPNSPIATDRQDGQLYKTCHQKWVESSTPQKQLRSATLNGDAVSPFDKSARAIYNLFLQLNEMSAKNRKKLVNNHLWILLPFKPDTIDMEILLRVAMYDLNMFNHSQSNPFEIRIDRIIADLPARSELLFYKQSGYYFCHLCEIKGERSGQKTIYPIEQTTLHSTVQFKFSPLRKAEDEMYYIEKEGVGTFPPHYKDIETKGLQGISPLLNQDWKPSPCNIACYDNMHFNYENLFPKMFCLIGDGHWKEFDIFYMKQKYPSFLHRNPRSISKNVTHLKAIETYMISHYYIDLFRLTPSYSKVKPIVEIICEYVNLVSHHIDSTDCTSWEKVKVWREKIASILLKFQQLQPLKTTQSFHEALDSIYCLYLFGPFWCNNAFIFEGLNNTLSKPFVCANSVRYAITYYDMTAVGALVGVKPPIRKVECICGNYIMNKNRDFLMKDNDVYRIKSNSSDYSTIELVNIQTNVTSTVTQEEIKSGYRPAVQLKYQAANMVDEVANYLPMHKMAFTFV